MSNFCGIAVTLLKRIIKKCLPASLLQARRSLIDNKFSVITSERMFLPVTAVEALSKDIALSSLPPREIHNSNNFYGLGDILKQYAGLPAQYSLKAVYTHIFYGRPWNGDLDSSLPVFLVWGDPMRKEFAARTNKQVFSIGPPLHYAVSIYDEKMVSFEKTRLGKNALIFPAHSTHLIQTIYPTDLLLKKAQELRQHFDSVRFCLYWKDILSGSARPFLESEYECVTAGHMFDPMFYSRLKGLLFVADHTYSNSFGTQAGLSVGLNIPHTIFLQDLHHEGDIYYKKSDPFLKIFVQFAELFCQNSDVITSRQKDFTKEYYGLAQVKTPSQLRRIFEHAESLYSAQR